MAIVSLVGLVLLLLGLIVLVASRRGLLGGPPAPLRAQVNSPKPEAKTRPESQPPVGPAGTAKQPGVQPGAKAASLGPASADTPEGAQPPAKPEPEPPPDAAAPAPADKQPLAVAPPKEAGKGAPAADVTPPSKDNEVPGEPGDQAEGQVKLSVPPRAARIHARQEVRKIYRDEYDAATEPGKKKSLAEKLLAVGLESRDDPETRYALFYEARELALAAADAKLLRKSIELLAKYYKVDPLEELSTSLKEASEERMTAAAKKALAPLALDLAKEAAADDDYAGAERLTEAAKEMAQGKDLAVVKQAGTLLERLAEGNQQYAHFREAQKVLSQKPDDLDANLVAGRFYCFVKNDEKSWARGLPLLAKGNDKTLKPLAEAELAAGGDVSQPSEMIKLADLWYQGASAVDASRRPDLLRRAAYWYRTALPDLAGFTKTKSRWRLEDIQQKLDDLPAAASGHRK